MKASDIWTSMQDHSFLAHRQALGLGVEAWGLGSLAALYLKHAGPVAEAGAGS